jgi:hypothetical protein
MENKPEVLYDTESLCPQCLDKVKAVAVRRGSTVYLEKLCGKHGAFSTVIWRGSPDISSWKADRIQTIPQGYNFEEGRGCPFDCGLCADHRQRTCTMLLEVTKRCNLKCSICFADSGGMSADPDLDRIRHYFSRALEQGGPFNIQLSGGEPTVRDDLPEIIRIGREFGFDSIQVNTNGLRFAADEDYVRELKAAGLKSILLQFDGVSDEIYKKLRGRELFDIKKRAIENCRKYDIGVVLVPVIIEENLNDTGRIISFALENIDIVRGVHFQPVSFFGRYDEDMKYNRRITLPEIMQSIEKESGGRIEASSFAPPSSEHSLCSFYGSFVYEEGELKPASGKSGSEVFSISAMAFQDAWTADIERLRKCCIHVMSEDGNLIPFCAYNMTDIDSNYLYRRR